MKIQTIKKQFLVLGLGLLAASVANANLIQNGSFEDLGAGSFNGSGWNYFTSVPGWTSADSTPIEIGLASVYGVTGQNVNNVMELDSTLNVTVSQDGLANGTYTLSFLYAARAGVSESSDKFQVLWNGTALDFTIGDTTFSPTSTIMALFTTTVTGSAGNNTLSFVGTGTSDSYGALIDDVQLYAHTPNPTSSVPEPSTWVAGMLLVLPFGIHGLRALRMRQQRA